MKGCLNPYIIGETAYIHEGDFNYLRKMIDAIAKIGLNAVKFHILLEPESYFQKKHPLVKEIGKWMLTRKEWDRLIERAAMKGLDIIMLCDDVASVEFIFGRYPPVNAIEIHATGLNDIFLLEAASKFKGRVMLGVGGSTVDEIEYAVNYLRTRGKEDLVLMYGFQSYPTDYKEINLSKMAKLRDIFHLPVGYADHTAQDDPNNEIISVMAAAMGFNILEKHFALVQGEERVDYHAGVGPAAMSRIKSLMEIALQVYGTGKIDMSVPEKNYGNTGPMKKALVARKRIKKGETISLDNVWFKRTTEETPVRQMELVKMLGRKASRDIKEDELIDFGKIEYEFRKHDASSFTHVKGKRR